MRDELTRHTSDGCTERCSQCGLVVLHTRMAPLREVLLATITQDKVPCKRHTHETNAKAAFKEMIFSTGR